MTLKFNRMITVSLAMILFLSISGCVPYYPAYSYNRGYSVYQNPPYGYYAPGYFAPRFGFGFRGGYGHGFGHGFHGHHFGGGHFGGHHRFH